MGGPLRFAAVLRSSRMPNKNYIRGVRFERERLKHYKETLGYDAVRTAGSHGKWDVVATDWTGGCVYHIQCKVVSDQRDGDRMLKRFSENPPFAPHANLRQRLEVKVTGSTEVHSVTV